MKQQPTVTVPWYNASSKNDGSCVDVQFLSDGSAQVRHSKKPDAEIITYDSAEWNAFITGAKAGKFDLPSV